MSTAAILNEHHRSCRTVSPRAVRVIVFDGDHAHCLDESHLDTWWNSLAPDAKAAIFEHTIEDGEERCRFCGCTQDHACEGGCAWLDPNHTVCSALACATQYLQEIRERLQEERTVDAEQRA